MKFRSLLVLALVVMGAFVLGCKKEEPTPAVPATENSVMKMTEDVKDAADSAVKDAEKAAGDVKTEAEKMVCPKCNMPADQCKCPK